MSDMTKQLAAVESQHGKDAMLDYAVRTLKVYRACARPQRDGKRHFAHVEAFRPHFVISICQLRRVLRDAQ